MLGGGAEVERHGHVLQTVAQADFAPRAALPRPPPAPGKWRASRPASRRTRQCAAVPAGIPHRSVTVGRPVTCGSTPPEQAAVGVVGRVLRTSRASRMLQSIPPAPELDQPVPSRVTAKGVRSRSMLRGASGGSRPTTSTSTSSSLTWSLQATSRAEGRWGKAGRAAGLGLDVAPPFLPAPSPRRGATRTRRRAGRRERARVASRGCRRPSDLALPPFLRAR